MTEETKSLNEYKKHINTMMALALIKHLYNQGKISKRIYQNIKNDTVEKVIEKN